LAKELGVETKDLIAKLEGLGYAAKRPQSSLEDDEIERVKHEYGRSDKPAVTVGGERVVRDGEGETVVERRVKSNVIRRRTTRQPDAEGGPLGDAPLESFSSSENTPGPVAVAPMPVSAVPVGDIVDLGGMPLPPPMPAPPPPAALAAPAPVVAEAPTAAVSQPPPPPPAETILPSAGPSHIPTERPPAPVRHGIKTTVAPKPLMDDGVQRGPKVLGRIDLRKTQPAPPPADARAGRDRPKRDGFTPGAPAAPAQPQPTTEADNRRKKKRRVIKEADAGELKDDSRGRGRIPRKKRAMPGKDIKKTEITTPKASKRVVKVSGVITVGDLAKAIGVKAAEILKKLMDSGMLATINQLLDADTATLLASDFGYNVENVAFDAESVLEEEHEETTEENAQPRPPVVTIMGHVDHGKTSLLDSIRSTTVTEQEHGGITQHIGAYSVDVGSRRVTFLDTPGHEAFTAMRARGAKVTDIVVLVVAADDSVMPQTIEAINHARAAAVPIVVAINKIDKPEADLERTRQGLADHGLVAEEWGGDTICAPVSAKTKEGIPHLLEMLLLQADLLDLKARPDKLARGTIVEAKLDRGRGPVATVLVQEGTLKKGDPFVCGGNYGRVRAMIDDHGRTVAEAGPSTPVEILGLQGVPDAGSKFVAVADEATARQVAEHRRTKQ
ncbi:MAG TPA: translation initiation factor IF-2, partial [Terriglobales bacterium]|nr:translation initiation factor IF-2 [Terriglobales bacterium]